MTAGETYFVRAYGYNGAVNAEYSLTIDAPEGGPGSDRIVSTSLDELFVGGGGSDIFALELGFGNDTIADFDGDPAGGQDLIELAGFGIDATTFTSDVTLAADSGGTLVSVANDPNQTILLAGVANTATITVDDFRFA